MKNAQTTFTASEWSRWLAHEEDRLRRVYEISPGHLIAEYRREREIMRGYHGREILELLQNAGDAARNTGKRGRVRIVVSERGVVMGNTGQPFDQGGVESLLTANLSPKRQIEAVVIGDKGLGFRSILNWTQAPIIFSGELGLAFLPHHAADVLRRLESENCEIAKRVAAEREMAGELVLPRLAFPQWIPNWAEHAWPDEAGLREIAATCGRLRNDGFDTAVGMPFAESSAYDEALRQVDELSPEFLLLVDSLGHLEIEIGSRARKTWTCGRAEDQWTIEGDQTISRWTVSTFDGEVPGDLLDQADKAKNRFTITLAMPNDGQPAPGRLFCYFPTDVELPLPLLAHATLELDETRKHVNDSRPNRHILSSLAARIADIAEKQTGQPNRDGWAGCWLVTPSASWSGELQRLGFVDALNDAASQRRLVPVLGGGRRTACESKVTPSDETKWWPARLFPEVSAVQRKEERKLAIALGVGSLSAEEILSRLLEADDLTIEERAYAVTGLLQMPTQIEMDGLSALFCDDTGTPIPKDTLAMLQPTEELPPLPGWAKLRFLHPDLRLHLARLLKTTDVRELQQKLKTLGVVEYSLAALIRPVLAEGNRRVREHPDEETQVRREIFQFLWRVYRQVGSDTAFPSEVSMRLPAQTGEWVAPANLYLGEGYNVEGNVTQDLYGGWAKGKLVVAPDQLAVEAQTSELTGLLMWLGLARWPRMEVATNVQEDFLTLVKNGLRYPVDFGGCQYNTRDDLPRVWIEDAYTVDGLIDILKNARPEAILAWLTLDGRVAAWVRPSPEHGKLKTRRYRAWYDQSYNGAVPSYTHWQISNFRWLPTAGGNRLAPRHCLLGDRQFEALFPQPSQPDPIIQHRYGISERVSDCYIRAGVMPGLARLGHDELYRLLLEIPALSPDGRTSRALCRWFLSNEADLFGYTTGEYQSRFFREGKVWGEQEGQAGYFAVTKLRHVDLDGMPPALLKKLPVADLPRRVGAEKVKRTLGITALDRAAIHQELMSCRPSPAHLDRRQWFEEAKPAVMCLRQAQTKQAQAMGTIERLELVLCDELLVRMEYESAAYDHTAREGEWFILSDNLYVRGDLEDSIDLLSDAAGMAIASVFGIAEGDVIQPPKTRQC